MKISEKNNYIENLAEVSEFIKRQFFCIEQKLINKNFVDDPLEEEKSTLIKGLVKKYPNRVLIKLTMKCAAYCQFCTRRRKISKVEENKLSLGDLDNILNYLDQHQEINEVIISGGDPLMVVDDLKYLLKKIGKMKQINVVRIHTRVPVSNPKLINQKILKIFKSINEQSLYVLINFEHPDELTKDCIEAVKKIRQTGAMVLSQSVFLKGINDSVETLKKLFNNLVAIGVKPYYIFQCDPVKGLENFMVPLKKEIEIMSQLRKEISGLACPTLVIDAPKAANKIPVPLNFWDVKINKFRDYKGKIRRTPGF